MSPRPAPGRTRILQRRWQVRETWRALDALEKILPASPQPSRGRIYAAIEALIVDLVAALEESGVAEDGPFREAGEFLDHCRRLRGGLASPGSRMGRALPRASGNQPVFNRA